MVSPCAVMRQGALLLTTGAQVKPAALAKVWHGGPPLWPPQSTSRHSSDRQISRCRMVDCVVRTSLGCAIATALVTSLDVTICCTNNWNSSQPLAIQLSIPTQQVTTSPHHPIIPPIAPAPQRPPGSPHGPVALSTWSPSALSTRASPSSAPAPRRSNAAVPRSLGKGRGRHGLWGNLPPWLPQNHALDVRVKMISCKL